LPGGQPPRGGAGEPAGQAYPREGVGDAVELPARGPDGETHVLSDGQILVQPAGRAEEADVAADGAPVAHEVVAEDDDLAAFHAQKPGAHAQKRGLAGAVRSLEQDHLAAADIEVGAGERGERSQKGDGRAEVDGITAGHIRSGYRQADQTDHVRFRTFLRGIGKTCISAGVLILLFVAYQLWGTGITEARAQHRLKAEFTAPVTKIIPVSQPAPPPVPGSAIALLRIPKISVNAAVVEGVSVDNLQHGPGHYPGTPMPGQAGNSAIAGHRTTYGAPFYRLDQLKAGDDIFVTTRDSPDPWHYVVSSSTEVSPSDVAVLDPTPDNRLTLTTCTPRFTAQRRLIVVSKLVGKVDPRPPTVVVANAPTIAGADKSLSGKGTSTLPAVLWAMACVIVWGLAWFVGYKWRRWATYLVASPVFLVCLFFFFQNFARFVPANI
jgi:sortase A